MNRFSLILFVFLMRRSAFRPLNKGLFNGLHGEVGVTTIDAVTSTFSCRTGLYLKLWFQPKAHRHLVSEHYASAKKAFSCGLPILDFLIRTLFTIPEFIILCQ